MFEQLFTNKEEKEMVRRESEATRFQREQNAVEAGSVETNQDLIDTQGKSDLIRWQQELQDELQEVIFQLKGYMKVKGQWVKPDPCNPLCNDLFIESVVRPQITPFISRNFINSNFDIKTILADLKHTSNEIADNMADGYDKYNIKFENYDLITRLLKNLMKAGSFRALQGWTKKTDSTIFKRVETSSDHDHVKTPPKGLFT